MSILIIDDSADDRLLLQAILSAAGYENILATDCAAAAFKQLGLDGGGLAVAHREDHAASGAREASRDLKSDAGRSSRDESLPECAHGERRAVALAEPDRTATREATVDEGLDLLPDLLGEPIDEDRQRVWFTHVGTLRTNLTLRGAVRYQTDSQIVRDFFETEHRQNAQPSTYVELNQVWSNWSLDLMAQPRVNDFQETVERLPDLKLTGLRQQVWGTPVFYESESSAGYYQREFAYVDTNRFSAFRGDTYHQLLLPWNFFGWLNVTPRVGGRFTYYGEADGPGATTEEERRGVFQMR